jgi:ribosomal protein S18 acetylase RimI-like enzyme
MEERRRILIRPAAPGDDRRCRAIHAAATMSSYGAIYRWLERIVHDPDTPLEGSEWMLVAELDGQVVGYVAVTGNHVENLYVDPAAQGIGVGSRLLAAVEERVIGAITLRCLVVNTRARSLYERCGFAVHHQERIDYHGRLLDAYFMLKRR